MKLKHKDLESCLSRTYLFYSITLQYWTWEQLTDWFRNHNPNYITALHCKATPLFAFVFVGAYTRYRTFLYNNPTRSVWLKFQVERVASQSNHSSCQKTRMNDLSCGIRMWAQVCFVSSQSMRLTDRQADGQKGFAIPCVALHAVARYWDEMNETRRKCPIVVCPTGNTSDRNKSMIKRVFALGLISQLRNNHAAMKGSDLAARG